MPIYEYKCNKCNKISEVLQKVSDKPLSKCPSCGGKVKKLMSHNSFQLKGGGWYVTDYKGKNSNDAPASSTDTATAATSSDASAPTSSE